MTSVALSGLMKRISPPRLPSQGVALGCPVRPLRGGMRALGSPLTRAASDRVENRDGPAADRPEGTTPVEPATRPAVDQRGERPGVAEVIGVDPREAVRVLAAVGVTERRAERRRVVPR